MARRFYLEGHSKIRLANEYGVSRFKIARLLDAARSLGLIQIELGHHPVIDVDLSARLKHTFNLTHAVVATGSACQSAATARALYHLAAQLLAEVVTLDDVLGLAWSRSVHSMVSRLGRLPPVPVVQLTGSLNPHASESHDSVDSASLVRDAARATGGPAYLFHAPLLFANARAATTMRRRPDIFYTIEKMRTVTTAVVGVGKWAPQLSELYDQTPERERRELAEKGVCAEVAGIFTSCDGTSIPTIIDERLIGPSLSCLRSIRDVIAIASNVDKASAVRAAIVGRLVNSLVTDTPMAHALLAVNGGWIDGHACREEAPPARRAGPPELRLARQVQDGAGPAPPRTPMT